MSNNRSVVYDLIASHGDVEDLVFFAVLMKGLSLKLVYQLHTMNKYK